MEGAWIAPRRLVAIDEDIVPIPGVVTDANDLLVVYKAEGVFLLRIPPSRVGGATGLDENEKGAVFRAGGDGVHVSPQKIQRLQNSYARWGSVFGGALAKPLVVVLTQKAYGFR